MLLKRFPILRQAHPIEPLDEQARLKRLASLHRAIAELETSCRDQQLRDYANSPSTVDANGGAHELPSERDDVTK